MDGGYTVTRVIRALDALADGSVSAQTLADALGAHVRTSRRLLHALVREGLVTRAAAPGGRFHATDALRELGARLAAAPGIRDRGAR